MSSGKEENRLRTYYKTLENDIKINIAATTTSSTVAATSAGAAFFTAGVSLGVTAVASGLAAQQGYKLDKNKKALAILQSALINSSDDQVGVASEIADLAFAQRKLINEGKDWHERVDREKISLIYAGILDTLKNCVHPEYIVAAKQDIADSLATYLMHNKEKKSAARKMSETGRATSVSFKTGACENIANHLKNELQVKFGDAYKYHDDIDEKLNDYSIILETISDPKSAKKNKSAQKILEASIKNSTPEQVATARKIASDAFIRSGLISGDEDWRKRVDVVKQAKIIASTLKAVKVADKDIANLPADIQASHLGLARFHMTAVLSDCLRAGIEGEATAERISFKSGTMKKISNALPISVKERQSSSSEFQQLSLPSQSSAVTTSEAPSNSWRYAVAARRDEDRSRSNSADSLSL